MIEFFLCLLCIACFGIMSAIFLAVRALKMVDVSITAAMLAVIGILDNNRRSAIIDRISTKSDGVLQ